MNTLGKDSMKKRAFGPFMVQTLIRCLRSSFLRSPIAVPSELFAAAAL
jgi:hypothetical protein